MNKINYFYEYVKLIINLFLFLTKNTKINYRFKKL